MAGRRALGVLLFLWCVSSLPAQPPMPAAGDDIPRGKMSAAIPFHSQIFPGTERNYWVWVPQQYDASKPTPFTVMQDGNGTARGWRLTESLEELMKTGEVPVQIVIFVDHGKVNGANQEVQTRFNRSFEYDSVGDRYARFLIEELIPEVKKSYNLSDNPNDRAIGGASSGAIAAFNVAWERPDQFRRVISAIGTYVGLRGADEFPTLIRKTESKPLRIFLQDGRNDQNIYGGNWWIANQSMLSALEYAGYEVQHAWGDGGHDTRQMAGIMPDILRFLWKDYPEPIKTRVMPAKRINILIQGEEWKPLPLKDLTPGALAVDTAGNLLVADAKSGQISRVSPDGTVSSFAKAASPVTALAIGPDGMVYACENSAVVRFSTNGERTVLANGISGASLLVIGTGEIYVLDATANRLHRLSTKGGPAVVQELSPSEHKLTSLSLSPDHAFVNLASQRGRFVQSALRSPAGELTAIQEYGWLHMPNDPSQHRAHGMAVDTIGNIYVTTSLGLQVTDPLGRVNLIVNAPAGLPQKLQSVTFWGTGFQQLAVSDGQNLFVRKVSATGHLPFQTPVKPPRPGL